MLDVVRYWLDLGMDGFRLDAVPYLYKRDAPTARTCPRPRLPGRAARHRRREYGGEKVLLAEANQWPEDVVNYFGTEDRPSATCAFTSRSCAHVHEPAP